MKLLLQYVVPLLFPLAIYILWGMYHKKEKAHHMSPKTLLFLMGSGVGLLFASLIVWNTMSGQDPDGTYQPPQMIDGKVVPGGIKKDQ